MWDSGSFSTDSFSVNSFAFGIIAKLSGDDGIDHDRKKNKLRDRQMLEDEEVLGIIMAAITNRILH